MHCFNPFICWRFYLFHQSSQYGSWCKYQCSILNRISTLNFFINPISIISNRLSNVFLAFGQSILNYKQNLFLLFIINIPFIIYYFIVHNPFIFYIRIINITFRSPIYIIIIHKFCKFFFD